MSIQIAIELDVAALLAGGQTKRDFVEFVKELDAEIGEWDFTLELAEHFAKLKAEHDAEVAYAAKVTR